MQPLWEYLRARMLEHPNQVVCENEAKMTYEELCAFAEEHGKNIFADHNAILCRSEMATAMALLACLAAGKTAIPIPTRYGPLHCKKIIDRLHPPCIITDLDGELNEVFTEYDREAQKQLPAVILFTSGSTGAPKGVMLNEKNLLSNVQDICSYFPIDCHDTILIARPIYHSSVLTGEFLAALSVGAKIVFSSEPFQPMHILDQLKKWQVTVFGGTPTLLATLSHFVRIPSELKVRLLSVSGECVGIGTARAIRKAFPGAQVFCGYGLSEASPRVAYLPSELFDVAPTAAGVPIASDKLRIVRTDGKDVSRGEVGELMVSGPNVMCGYWDDETRTKQTLCGKWLHTGDMAKRGDDGLLYIKGRKDDMIIRAGMNIYPAEIENALSEDGRVRTVRAYGYDSQETQEIGLEICGDFAEVAEVMELCRKKLSPYQIPSKIDIREEIHMLSGGKRKRGAA